MNLSGTAKLNVQFCAVVMTRQRFSVEPDTGAFYLSHDDIVFYTGAMLRENKPDIKQHNNLNWHSWPFWLWSPPKRTKTAVGS